MSAMFERVGGLIRRIRPSAAAKRRRWVEPSSEITRSVYDPATGESAETSEHGQPDDRGNTAA